MRPNNFDLIRLLAAFQVVMLHAKGHLKIDNTLLNISGEVLSYFPGVPIFFFLSGFLVSKSVERCKSIRSYAVSRSLRILPGLWCCFIFSVIVVFALSPSLIINAEPKRLAAWIFAQTTIFQFFNPEFLRTFGCGTLNGSLWTIPVEIQFYICTPIVYYLFIASKKRSFRNSLILLTFFIAISQVINLGSGRFDNAIWFKLILCSMLPYYWIFVLGLIAQRNFKSIEPLIRGKLVHWLVIYICVIFLCRILELPVKGHGTFPIVTGCLAGVTLALAYTWPKLSDNLLRHNDISYGIYVYHMVIVNAFIEMKLTHNPVYLLFVLLLTFICATASWLWIEKPCIQLKKKWIA